MNVGGMWMTLENREKLLAWQESAFSAAGQELPAKPMMTAGGFAPSRAAAHPMRRTLSHGTPAAPLAVSGQIRRTGGRDWNLRTLIKPDVRHLCRGLSTPS